MRIDIRFWTAMAVIGICVFSVTHGWRIVHFSLATENIDVFEWAEVIDTWTAVPEVASAALREKLKEEINIADPKAANGRGETFSSILSIGPSSSLGWLSLSGLRWATHRPMEQILGSLKLSMLTGPNEGYVMAERGIFGVSLWESLSPDLKRGVATDLARAEMNQKFPTVLSKQPVSVKNELRDALLATGLSPKEIEQRLGY